MAELFETVADDIEESARIFRSELRNEQPFVGELCRYIEQFRGKQLRPALLLLTGQACGGVRREHRVLAAVVEMVHLATLVHDDVLDDADMRRRAATVSRRWGNEPAVLLGDFLFSHAFRLCSGLDSQFASQLIGETAVTLCAGELMQVSNCNNYGLTEDEYFEIIARKTAALIGACCLLGAKYAGADQQTVRRMNRFGVGLGLAFQITDDLLDLTGDEAEVGKSLGRDVQKGKLTLPLIHYLRTCRPHRREDALALLRSDSPGRHRQIAELLADSDSIEYAQQTAYVHIRQSLDILSDLPPSDARASLTALAEFIVARRQ
ncbi:MAG: polyprenyl synthetase family protein [Phycisphaerae bacterium]